MAGVLRNRDQLLRVAETPDAPSAERFFKDYVQTNTPLIVRGGGCVMASHAMATRHTDRVLGDKVVTVAPLETAGPHAFLDKWLETSDVWGHTEHERNVCDTNNLLVVSAMRIKMRLKKFFKLLNAKEYAFYADGAGNLEHSFPYLRGDFSPPQFASALHLKRADLWLGGKSISRMHYDNLDNVFAQVVGSKTFIVEPSTVGAAIQGGSRLRKAARLYTHPGQFTREGGGDARDRTQLSGRRQGQPSCPQSPSRWAQAMFCTFHLAGGMKCTRIQTRRLATYASLYPLLRTLLRRLGGKTATKLGSLLVNPRYDDDDDGDDDDQVEKGVTIPEREGLIASLPSRQHVPLALGALVATVIAVAVAAAAAVARINNEAVDPQPDAFALRQSVTLVRYVVRTHINRTNLKRKM